MFLNIITPCSRPENLIKIEDSINIPKESYRWIIVYDSEIPLDKSLIPKNAELSLYKDKNSIVGHAQRNFALDLVKEGYVYFNDDDTLLHPELWDSIKDINNVDFISFKQNHKNGDLRLIGDNINVGYIDSHNFIVKYDVIDSTKFYIDRYDADGFFAVECYKKSIYKLYINKVLSIYNLLR
jgi:hypothetical protein